MYINRRAFLKGAAGLGVAAAAASTAFYIKNQSPEAVAELMENVTLGEADILVIGGGIAGVMAAIRAQRNGGNVVLVDKGSVGRSGQTPFANGFRVFDEEAGDDRETWHEAWTANTGGIHHSAYADNMMDYSKEIYDELTEWGATEVGFGKVLRSKVQEEGIEIVERTMLTTLLEQDGVVAGAVGFNLDTEEAYVIRTKAVILATGAGAFKPNGFQVRSLTSDGDAMAYRIGAKISGKEYIDTHFTGSDNPADCWGNWEAMWNTGMMKETGAPEANGMGLDLSMFHMAHAGMIPATMSGPGEMPADVEIPEGMEPPEGMEVPEDAEGDGASGESGRQGRGEGGPGGGSAPGSGSGDQIGGASGGLGVHKAEGLYPMDDKCGTNITGLFAAGDCLSSMLAGTKYTGLNGMALSGSACQGALAGETAADYVKTATVATISDADVEAIQADMFSPRELTEGYDPAWVTQMLQFNTLPYYILYIKNGDRMQAALDNILFFKEHFADKMVASNSHELRLVHETRNMLLNAEMKLRASLFRTESRGNHYREDYPDESSDWLAWVVIEQDDNGDMSLSKVPVA